MKPAPSLYSARSSQLGSSRVYGNRQEQQAEEDIDEAAAQKLENPAGDQIRHNH